MIHLDVVKQILMSNTEYWVFEKRETFRDGDETQIIFAAIPRNIQIGLEYDKITLKQVDQFDRLHLDSNVFLSHPYAPFQIGISFSNIINGFPLDEYAFDFFDRAIQLKSKNYYEYKALYKEICNAKTPV